MAEISDGTGGGIALFLDWAADHGELNKATAAAHKTAVAKVLEIEPVAANEVDLRSLDVTDTLRRFETKNRGNYGSGSMASYLGRFRRSVAMYLAWLDKQPNWAEAGRVASSPRTRATSPAAPRMAKAAPPKRRSSGASSSVALSDHGTGSDSLIVDRSAPAMVPYELPLRPGLRVRLVLPDDLTPADARRIAAFVSSLAFEPEPAAANSQTPTGAWEPSTAGEEE